MQANQPNVLNTLVRECGARLDFDVTVSISIRVAQMKMMFTKDIETAVKFIMPQKRLWKTGLDK